MGLCRNFTQYTFRQGGRLNDNPRQNAKDLKTEEFNLKQKKSRIVYTRMVTFLHSPILHYAFSSWTEHTMTKTIHCHWENRFVYNNSMGLCGNFTHLNKSREYFDILMKKSYVFSLTFRMTLKCGMSPSKFFLLSSAVKYYSRTGVKFPHSPKPLLNKSVFPMAMYYFCHCFLYPRTECIM